MNNRVQRPVFSNLPYVTRMDDKRMDHAILQSGASQTVKHSEAVTFDVMSVLKGGARGVAFIAGYALAIPLTAFSGILAIPLMGAWLLDKGCHALMSRYQENATVTNIFFGLSLPSKILVSVVGLGLEMLCTVPGALLGFAYSGKMNKKETFIATTAINWTHPMYSDVSSRFDVWTTLANSEGKNPREIAVDLKNINFELGWNKELKQKYVDTLDAMIKYAQVTQNEPRETLLLQVKNELIKEC